MRICSNDFKAYTYNAPHYLNGLVFIISGIQQKDIDALTMWLRRLCSNNQGLSFYLVVSSHESKGSIQKTVIHTGKVGRPKTIVKGKRVDRHCHGLIVNENESNDMYKVNTDLHYYFKKRRDKRPNLKRQKIADAWKNNLSIVKYMERQADNTFRGGTFDFDYFTSVYYMPEPYKDNYENILDFD